LGSGSGVRVVGVGFVFSSVLSLVRSVSLALSSAFLVSSVFGADFRVVESFFRAAFVSFLRTAS
jgi:hypothetical protein